MDSPARPLLYVDPACMTALLIQMYDRWVAHRDPRPRIRELEAVHNRLDRTEAAVCTLAGGCHGLYYAIRLNGDVAHCDLYVGDPRSTLGNLLEHSFGALRARAELVALQDENERALEAMRDCPASPCATAGARTSAIARPANPGHDPGCCGLRALIDHVRAGERWRHGMATPGLQLAPA